MLFDERACSRVDGAHAALTESIFKEKIKIMGYVV